MQQSDQEPIPPFATTSKSSLSTAQLGFELRVLELTKFWLCATDFFFRARRCHCKTAHRSTNVCLFFSFLYIFSLPEYQRNRLYIYSVKQKWLEGDKKRRHLIIQPVVSPPQLEGLHGKTVSLDGHIHLYCSLSSSTILLSSSWSHASVSRCYQVRLRRIAFSCDLLEMVLRRCSRESLASSSPTQHSLASVFIL